MDKSHKASLHSIGSDPLAPKLQEYIGALLPQVYPRKPRRVQDLTQDAQCLQRRHPRPGFPRPHAVDKSTRWNCRCSRR